MLTEDGRCERHRGAAKREYEQHRPSAAKRGYGRPWQKYRLTWLSKHPLCGDRRHGASAEHSRCRAEGRVTAATDVDHITPHRGDSKLFWDPDNHQSLCGSCHDAKTAREDGGFGRASRRLHTEGEGGSNL